MRLCSKIENIRPTNVAAHVHADTIPVAISPGFTLRDALVNSSASFGEYVVYRACIPVTHIITTLKKSPIPKESLEIRMAVKIASQLQCTNQ